MSSSICHEGQGYHLKRLLWCKDSMGTMSLTVTSPWCVSCNKVFQKRKSAPYAIRMYHLIYRSPDIVTLDQNTETDDEICGASEPLTSSNPEFEHNAISDEPQKIIQNELNDLVRDLELPKNLATNVPLTLPKQIQLELSFKQCRGGMHQL